MNAEKRRKRLVARLMGKDRKLMVDVLIGRTDVVLTYDFVSAIVDIGCASFKYDMRRLTEILAFPKAWYRRSIVRRLFLGDLSMSAAYSEDEDSPTGSGEEEANAAVPGSARHVPEKSPLPARDKLKLPLDAGNAIGNASFTGKRTDGTCALLTVVPLF